VSTILKVLKRLETEQERSQAAGSPAAAVFSLQNTVRRKSAFALFRNRVLVSTIIGLMVLVGIIVLFALIERQPKKMESGARQTFERHTDFGGSEVHGNRRASPAARSGPVNPGGVVQNGLPDREISMPQAANRRDSLTPVQPQGQPPPSVPTSTAKPLPQANARPPLDDGEQRADTVARRMENPPRAPLPKDTSAPERQSDDPYVGAQRMTDGRLKVQAIAWAPEPPERMAVVNNRIVREGGTLEGFFVVGIGKEAIFVRENGRLLKVLFGEP